MTDIPQQTHNPREAWEQEIYFGHRWGHPRHGEKAVTEHARLKAYWSVISADARPPAALLEQIVALEICNWNLESSIPALCRAIGANERVKHPIGHLASCTEERWRKIWAYVLALREWLPHERPSGHAALLDLCDPDGAIADHIQGMLGERTVLKELYVERFCLSLEYRLRGQDGLAAEHCVGQQAAITVLEAEIARQDPDSSLLQAMSLQAGLFPCHHKLFRRYAIILSSIGVGKWRGAMAEQGDGPRERAATLEQWLQPIEAWLEGSTAAHGEAYLYLTLAKALGPPNPTKRFLAALLVSLLRSQIRMESARMPS